MKEYSSPFKQLSFPFFFLFRTLYIHKFYFQLALGDLLWLQIERIMLLKQLFWTLRCRLRWEKMWECHSFKLVWMVGSYINQCSVSHHNTFTIYASAHTIATPTLIAPLQPSGCDLKRSDSFLMKGKYLSLLMQHLFISCIYIQTSGNGFCCYEKWILLYAKAFN